MREAGFARRVAPALVLAAAGGVFLYLLPTGADSDSAASDDAGFPSSATSSGGATASSATSNSGASPTAPNTQRVIQGDAINFRFGTVQVKIALDGKTLTNIATISAPGGSYQRYTDRAIPEMKAKILAAQSTHVAAASGATYTSEAYAQSVQSALDKS
ncbi:MAG: FMN-binding protein [bacterium]|nr:FMN-binding protein [bacterium]